MTTRETNKRTEGRCSCDEAHLARIKEYFQKVTRGSYAIVVTLCSACGRSHASLLDPNQRPNQMAVQELPEFPAGRSEAELRVMYGMFARRALSEVPQDRLRIEIGTVN